MRIYLLSSLSVTSAIRIPRQQNKLKHDESVRNLLQTPNSSLALAISKEKPNICVANPADFCEITWLLYPNLNAAMFGIDLPSLNSVPNDFISEPGMTNQIFLATYRNLTGSMAQYNSVQTIDDLRCSTLFDLNIYSTFEDLIDGWRSMEQSGLGTNIGFNTKFNFGHGIGGSIEFSPLFSRSQSKQHEAEGLQEHFSKDKGSVAHSRAEC